MSATRAVHLKKDCLGPYETTAGCCVDISICRSERIDLHHQIHLPEQSEREIIKL